MINILVVDDEYLICKSIDMFMSEKGHVVHSAATIKEGLSLFKELSPEVVILDIRLPDGSGLDALSRMYNIYPLSKIIMITAFQDMGTTIDAMKKGAYDYIHKPLDADELEKTVDEAISSFYANAQPPRQYEDRTSYKKNEIIGKSKAMKEIYKMIGMLCQNRATVLITGETGTGKEIVAKQIHYSGQYRNKPFVTFDCSSVVENLMESELFGHEKGAFTGAVDARPGKIELAGEGTIFIDEVGELPLNLQAKLLGFLERKRYTRVGGKAVLKSMCRIIVATNKDLKKMVSDNTFRDDLYYRLKVATITPPPLRHRLSDIKDLVDHFIIKSERELGVKKATLQAGCIERLKQHPWTGNVRELENTIIAASIQTKGTVILLDTIENLLSDNSRSAEQNIIIDSLAGMESRHIFNILQSVKWHKTKASEILKISLPTLRKKIKKYQLSPQTQSSKK